MGIDEEIEEVLKEESPQGKAVETLIKVKSKNKGETSEIELKTDLSEAQVNTHTVVDIMDEIMIMPVEKWKKGGMLGQLVERKERKLLSKNRRSRLEIVEVARHPDVQNIMPGQDTGFLKKFFQGNRKA